MEYNELISVIIPTYKRNDTLIRAIESVYSQTYTNTEIIVVDDNANFPEVRQKNREILARYSKVRLVENSKNLGGGLSRNEGIRHATGDYIAFLDDDDEYLPEKIEKQYTLLKELSDKRVAMVYCYANLVRVDGSTYLSKKDVEGIQLLANVQNCIAGTSYWMCPKKALLDVGGFEDISSRQDASLITKFFLNGYEVYRVPEVLVNYYWHDAANGISKNDKKTAAAEQQYRQLYIKNSDGVDRDTHEKILYAFSYRLALIYLLIGDKASAMKEYREMKKYGSWGMQHLRIQFGIRCNKLYRYISTVKNSRSVGR